MKRIIQFAIPLMTVAAMSTTSLAVVPDLIPVQGVLTNTDDTIVDGATDVTFTIYDAKQNGTALWTESYTGSEQLLVDNGYFVAYLGAITPLDFSTMLSTPELWLAMEVNSDGQMDRIRIGSVPFAMQAQTCEQIGTLTAGDIQPRLNIGGDTSNGTCPAGQYVTGINPTTGVITCSAVDVAMDTITVVSANSDDISAGSFGTIVLPCPASHPIVVSCGIDLENVLYMATTSLAPTIGGERIRSVTNGEYTTEPDGCRGSARNDATQANNFRLAATCRKGI